MSAHESRYSVNDGCWLKGRSLTHATWVFDPHVGYRIAKAIFGDIDAAACPVKFVFGFTRRTV